MRISKQSLEQMIRSKLLYSFINYQKGSNWAAGSSYYKALGVHNVLMLAYKNIAPFEIYLEKHYADYIAGNFVALQRFNDADRANLNLSNYYRFMQEGFKA